MLGNVTALPAHAHMCNSRNLLAGRLDVDSSSVAMSQVHYDSDFSGYSVGALLGSSQLLALGNVSGSIKLVRLDRQGQ